MLASLSHALSKRTLRLLLTAGWAVLGLHAMEAHAQSVQPWPDLFVTVRLPNDWTVSGEAIGRVADDSRTSQAETRAQVGRILSKRVTVWLGWVHIANFNPHAANTSEDQVVEQLNWTIGALGPVRLSTRTRLEQRFIEGVGDTSWRWRQQVRVAVPLAPKHAPSFVLWAEPFVALNRTGAQSHTLDQLRSFAGLSFPISERIDWEIGYLNQRLYRRSGTIVNDAVPIVLNLRF
jgi:hypothetical protein